MIAPPPLPSLVSRYKLATLMVQYFARTDDMPDLERQARDLIVPVGKELKPHFQARAVLPHSPLEFWSDELSYVLGELGAMMAPPFLLPAHTDDVVLLGPVDAVSATAS